MGKTAHNTQIAEGLIAYLVQGRQFMAALIDYSGWKLVGVAGLVLLAACIEGAGILLLIPLLQAIGIGDQSAGPISSIDWLVKGLFNVLGLQPTLEISLMLLFAVSVIRFAIGAIREVTTRRLNANFTDSLRKRVFAAIVRTDWVFLGRTKPDEMTQVLNRDLDRVSSGIHFTFQLVALVPTIVVQLAIAASISLLATGLTLLLVVLAFFTLLPHIRRAQQLGVALTENHRRALAASSELMSAVKLTKSLGGEAEQQKRFATAIDDTRTGEMAFLFSSLQNRAVYNLTGILSLSVLVYAGVRWINIPGAELMVLIALFARTTPMVSAIQNGAHQLAFMLPAFANAMAIENRCIKHTTTQTHPTTTNPFPNQLRSGIDLKNIEFRYAPEQAHALDGINLSIAPGERLALIGPSGAGKTTLGDMLLGLLVPTAGSMTVDGKPVLAEHLAQWRQRVAYVPQDPFLFHDSIRANLLWGRADAQEAELWRILDRAAAKEFVENLPDGLDTIVGARGQSLSGGERQRLTIARALMRLPLLIVLDEATSALDPATEEQVRQSLNGLDQATAQIIITHDLRRARHANRIIVMKSGHVVASGDWSTLTAKGVLSGPGGDI